MSAAVSRPAPTEPLPICWIALPAAICTVIAVGIFLGGVNESWFLSWNQLANERLPPFLWAAITNLGATLGAFALITPALAWRPRLIAATLLAAPTATIYTHALKSFFAEPRPPAVLALEDFNVIGLALRTDSFPSGHSTTAFVLGGIVTLCAHPVQRRWLGWVALGAAALIAFSRVAVGAHWPLDIFAGAAGGWLSAAIGMYWSNRWRFWEGARGVRLMAALMLVIAALLAYEDLGYPEGLWMQYLLIAWCSAGAVYALLRPPACRTYS